MDKNNNVPEKKSGNSPIQRLRTYKSDIADSLKKQKQSFVGMVIAETKKREAAGATQPEQTRDIFTQKVIFIGLGILLVTFAIGISVFLVFQARTTEQVIPSSLDLQSPIFLENHKIISIERFSGSEIRNKVKTLKQEEDIPINGMLGITFTKIIETSDGAQKVLLPTSELLSILEHGAPQQLIRTFNDSFLFGFHAFRKTEPFLILTNKFYDGAFLGMLQWEPFIAGDLSTIFLLDGVNFRRTKLFEDAVIQNNDVRILRDTNNRTLLLYSFIDRSTIVITTNIDAFKAIVTRLKTPQRRPR